MRDRAAIVAAIAAGQHGIVTVADLRAPGVSRAAFEEDVARRRRSNHVAYTYGDVFERPAETIADLRARLGR